MLSSCLFPAFIISIISTLIYSLMNDKLKNDKLKNDNENVQSNKLNNVLIFTIVMIVSIIILFYTKKNNTEQIIPLNGGFSPKINNKPPF